MDALNRDSGKYWYLGTLFSGIAYVNDTDSSVRTIVIAAGECTGDYITPYFFAASNVHAVDLTGFTEDDIGDRDSSDMSNAYGFSYEISMMRYKLSWNHLPYTGLCYEFQGPFCVRELGYLDGLIVSDAQWGRSGQLRLLSFQNETDKIHEIDECYSWFPNGELKEAWITLSKMLADHSAERQLHFAVDFTDSGKISLIEIYGAQNAVDKMIAEHPFFPIKKIADLENFMAAERFIFYDDISADLFAEMASNDAFQSTRELELPSGLLDCERGFESVAHMRELEKIILFDEEGDAQGAAERIKRRRPDIKVLLRRRAVNRDVQFEYIEIE